MFLYLYFIDKVNLISPISFLFFFLILLDVLSLVTGFPDYSEYNENYVFLAFFFRYGKYLVLLLTRDVLLGS